MTPDTDDLLFFYNDAVKASTRKGLRRFSDRSILAQIYLRMDTNIRELTSGGFLSVESFFIAPLFDDAGGQEPSGALIAEIRGLRISSSSLLPNGNMLPDGSRLSRPLLTISPFHASGLAGSVAGIFNHALIALFGSDWLVERECRRALAVLAAIDFEAREIYGLATPNRLAALIDQQAIGSAIRQPTSRTKHRNAL